MTTERLNELATHHLMEFSADWCRDVRAEELLIAKMRERGFWCRRQNGFTAQDHSFWAGFTPQGTTGWNGTPDNWTKDEISQGRATVRAALNAIGVPGIAL